ncbi:MAG TPA: hypothetical protein VKD22_05820, partial [Ramlibacter sp.]|nr:hypothetical protein [Ramlibacter sp.]
MRPGIDGPTAALVALPYRDVHVRVEVANGSGTLIDLTSRCQSVMWTDPNPQQPIGSLDVVLVRENAARTASLAPFVAASSLNVLDDGVTFSPLVQIGRAITLEIAFTAEKAARPADDSALWYEVFRGRVGNVAWPQNYGGQASIHALDQGGRMQKEKAEAEHTYAAGTAVETVAQAALDDFYGAGTYTLSVPAASGAVLSNDYAPGQQKTLWQIVQELATSIGWVAWYRYSSRTASALTFFEPARTKAVSDATVPAIYSYDALSVDENEIANVLYGKYVDDVGAAQVVGPIESTASIAAYGGIRRSAWIALGEDSAVRSAADMTALLGAALSDMADPDAIASVTVPLFPFTEAGNDLLTFDDPQRVRFDSPQLWAPYSVTHTIAANQNPTTTMQVRGKPSAGFRAWDGRAKEYRPPAALTGFTLTSDDTTALATADD